MEENEHVHEWFWLWDDGKDGHESIGCSCGLKLESDQILITLNFFSRLMDLVKPFGEKV